MSKRAFRIYLTTSSFSQIAPLPKLDLLPFNDIKIVPVIILLDNVVAFGDLSLEHCVYDVSKLLGLQRSEEQNVLHCLHQGLSLHV